MLPESEPTQLFGAFSVDNKLEVATKPVSRDSKLM